VPYARVHARVAVVATSKESSMATSPLVSRTGAPTEARPPSNRPPSISRSHRPPTGPLRLPEHLHAVHTTRAARHRQQQPIVQTPRGGQRLLFAWTAIATCKTIAPCSDYLPRAHACPSCGTAPHALTWVAFMSPESTWKALCGTAGILTICWPCQSQIDYFESFHS
jgi:hypothetical protein